MSYMFDHLQDSTNRAKLVVVGDQSSGKPSLPESLTGISFPRDVELCTRHATQITMRRDRQTRVEIRIIPGLQTSEENKARLEAYIHTVALQQRSSFLVLGYIERGKSLSKSVSLVTKSITK